MANWEKRDEQHGKKGDSQGGSWGGSGEPVFMRGLAAGSSDPVLMRGLAAGHAAGLREGRAAGFREGYQSGLEYGEKIRCPEPTAETDQSAAGSSKKRKKGGAWKAWRETYTTFEEDKATEPYYYTRTGSTTIAIYPAEIQEKLRSAAENTCGGFVSQDVEYDMTDGWVYKIRLFNEVEKPHWIELLAKVATAEDGELVGAQWDNTKATRDPGLGGFEEQVKYRPVFLRDVQPAM